MVPVASHVGAEASALATNLFMELAINYSSPASIGTLSFSTPPNQFGTNTISVTVNDGGASNSFLTRTFTVRVVSVNDPPSIGSISPQTTEEDTPITINFTVGDVETPAANLTVSGTSSNTGLVSPASMTFGGQGGIVSAASVMMTRRSCLPRGGFPAAASAPAPG